MPERMASAVTIDLKPSIDRMRRLMVSAKWAKSLQRLSR